MAEYIDREKIREEVCKDCTRRIGKDGCMAPEACEDLLTALVAADPADVAPVVHGRWVWKQGPCEDECNLICSNCGLESVGHYDEEDDPYQYERTSFCHHCGAKMDGGEKDAEVQA